MSLTPPPPYSSHRLQKLSVLRVQRLGSKVKAQYSEVKECDTTLAELLLRHSQKAGWRHFSIAALV